MNLKDQLREAAKPFLMKEGLDSSKEMIANNAASFDEMGMANSNPGEFAPEEITDQENLVNVAKMSNDNDFNSEEGEAKEISVSVVGTELPGMEELADIVNLGGGECPECHGEHGHHSLGDMIESILRKKDRAVLESLEDKEEVCPECGKEPCECEAEKKEEVEEASEEDPIDEMATYYPGVLKDEPGEGKAADRYMRWLKNNLAAIKSGEHVLPDDVKNNWAKIKDNFKRYSNSNLVSPLFKKTVEKTVLDMAGGDPAKQQELLMNPSEEVCAAVGDKLNGLLGNKIEFEFEPGKPLLQTLDRTAKNYLVRDNFQKAYNNELETSGKNSLYNAAKEYDDWANPAEVANPFNFADEDIALLKQYNIQPDHPKAKALLKVLKPKAPKESVLAESDYAGNLAYNPDKRLNASDVLNAVKNAVKPEFAAALSVVKNVDANEEPSYAIQNIDEKDLPATIEIDTNTDKNVVLKKDGNSYKISK